MVTRKDVAERAGVSVATVSYVMNHTKKVTPEVEKRVRDAVEELGYRPNLIARSLVTKQTHHVAMLVDNLKNPHNTSVLEGAQSVAGSRGYMISSLLVDYANQDMILELTARGVDGYLLFHPGKKQEFMKLLKNQYWVIADEADLTIDCQEAIFKAVKSLKDHGHEQIAYLSGLSIYGEKDHYRLRNYREAMEKYDLPLNENLIIDGNPQQTTDEPAGMEAVRRLLASGEKFTAIMAVNDLMAIGAIRELHLHGIHVPEDVSVVGCDNIRESLYSVPSISTLDVKSFDHGRYLMEKLICKMEGREFSPVTIHASYIERESVGKNKKRYLQA